MISTSRASTRHDRASRARGGFTLLEVALVIGVFSTVFVALGTFFTNSTRGFAAATVRAHGSSRAQAVLDRIVEEMLPGVFSSIDPAVPSNATTLRFLRVVSVSAGNPVYGNPVQIDLVATESSGNDDIDNDNDGLVDEAGIRIWEDLAPLGSTPGPEDTPVMITESVEEGGLTFMRLGSVLLVTLKYTMLPDRGEDPVTIEIASGVRMRN